MFARAAKGSPETSAILLVESGRLDTATTGKLVVAAAAVDPVATSEAV